MDERFFLITIAPLVLFFLKLRENCNYLNVYIGFKIVNTYQCLAPDINQYSATI